MATLATATLSFTKETKTTLRYDAESGPMKNAYIDKSVFKDAKPDQIEIEIRAKV